jgi:hypothetical protein
MVRAGLILLYVVSLVTVVGSTIASHYYIDEAKGPTTVRGHIWIGVVAILALTVLGVAAMDYVSNHKEGKGEKNEDRY